MSVSFMAAIYHECSEAKHKASLDHVHIRRHARTCVYDSMTSPRFLMTISGVTDAWTKKTHYRIANGVLLSDNPAC